MLDRISDSVYAWREIHGEARNEPYPWNSYVIRAPARQVIALVDPLPMSPDERAETEKLGMPTHILCFAHGTPVRDAPRERLERYLASDSVWEALETEKRNSPKPEGWEN